jgi:hypothetical protein
MRTLGTYSIKPHPMDNAISIYGIQGGQPEAPNQNKEREEGFYWVRYFGRWEVARFEHGRWWVTGNEMEDMDSDFHEIDERRITREKQ